MYLLNRRFQQHQQIIWQGKGGVQDRTIYEDSVFAKVHNLMCVFVGVHSCVRGVLVLVLVQHCTLLLSVCVCVCVCVNCLQVLKDSGMMEEREYQTYRSLFSNMSNFMYVSAP